ncbi:MAG: hypothetical protein R6U96_10135 [Promethearchaeia archaeon]
MTPLSMRIIIVGTSNISPFPPSSSEPPETRSYSTEKVNPAASLLESLFQKTMRQGPSL